jgi:hypothetical protein
MISIAVGSASVWGMSSGGIVAPEAARAGVQIEQIAAYEPAFIVDSRDGIPPADFVPGTKRRRRRRVHTIGSCLRAPSVATVGCMWSETAPCRYVTWSCTAMMHA